MVRSVGALVQRVLRTYPGRLLQAFLGSQATNYANGLAFNAFMSMFPLIVGLLAILGLATQDPHARQQFVSGALTIFPADAKPALTAALDGVRNHSGLFGVIGILGFLWGGSNLFVSMEYALGRMFGARQRDFLRQRAMSLVMTAVFAVSVVATIGLNTLSLASSVPYLEPVISFVVWLCFFSLVYRVVPNRTYRLRGLWPGIVLAGVFMEAFSLLWPLVAGLTHGFNTYGTTFALFFLLATWLLFLAEFTLLGAVAIRMHAGKPIASGLISTSEPEPLETDATHAADQYRRRAA
ncbi:MAG: YihY/virulence factor BrkB family protein [Candidatus Dormibacteria bacterium]